MVACNALMKVQIWQVGPDVNEEEEEEEGQEGEEEEEDAFRTTALPPIFIYTWRLL